MQYTNLDINTRAKIIHIIQSAELIHWYEGLTQATKEINKHQEAIAVNQHQDKLIEIEYARLALELESLQSIPLWRSLFEWIHPIAKAKRSLKIKELTIKITELDRNKELKAVQYRDTELMLETAQEQYNRIFEQHKDELKELEFSDLQRLHTHTALTNRHAKFLAARMLSRDMGLPESTGEMLLSLPADQFEVVLTEANAILQGQQIKLIAQEALQALSHLSPKQQKLALISAAKTVIETT